MLSLEEQSVYDALCAITGDNEVYKIVEADEIMEALPPAVKLTKVQLSQIIKDLKERDYIRVKYFTPEEYCLLTPKLAPVSSSQPAQPVEATVVAKPERELYGEKKKNRKGGERSPQIHGVFYGAFGKSARKRGGRRDRDRHHKIRVVKGHIRKRIKSGL